MLSRRFGLPERLLAILLLVALVDFAANTLLFDRASQFALREDDAARVAENLIIATRAIERAPVGERRQVAKDLSSARFALDWQPSGNRPGGSIQLSRLRQQIIEDAPELGRADLQLHLKPVAVAGNITGSLTLPDRSIVQFQTYASDAWTLNAGRILTLMMPTLALVLLAWVLFRATLAPLRTLVRASKTVGS